MNVPLDATNTAIQQPAETESVTLSVESTNNITVTSTNSLDINDGIELQTKSEQQAVNIMTPSFVTYKHIQK